MSCEACDIRRERDAQTRQIGKPCDICNDTGTDYIGRPCRHCSQKKQRI